MYGGLKKAAFGVILWKLLLLSFVALLPSLWPAFNLSNYAANFHWPPDAVPSRGTLFATWDAQHFFYLAREGYQPGALSNHFLPLWPWVMRSAGSGLGGALALSNLFSLAGLLLFFDLVRSWSDEETALLSTAVLLAYPGAFFLCLPYSESLFFFLAVLLFRSLRREILWPAALAAFLLPLTRPQGIAVAPAFWYCLYARRKTKLEDAAHWAAPLAGLAAYLFFMLHATGDAFEGLKTHRDLYPEHPSLLKFLDPIAFVRAFFHVTAWHDIFGSAMDRLWFVLYTASLPAIWKRDRVLFVYALAMGFIAAVPLELVSFTRHLLLVFPVFIVGGELLSRSGRTMRWLVLLILAALQIFLLARHANNYWVAAAEVSASNRA